MNLYKLWTALLLFALLGLADAAERQRAGLQAQIDAMSGLQVAREGKTDKSYYAQNPKHFPLSATSVRGKSNGSTTQTEADRERSASCGGNGADGDHRR